MGYGFSLVDNPADHFSLSFSPAIAAYIKTTRDRRSSHSCKSVIEMKDYPAQKASEELSIHWVRIHENLPDFSPHFLEDFSIAIENSRERHQNEDSLQANLDLLDSSLSRNKLHVLCAVFMILQKRQTAIRKYDENLPESPRNSRQVDAARYRRSQLRILNLVITHLDNRLGSHLRRREFLVVNLEDILTQSPKGVQKDLRSILNAGMKTRDPGKIKDRGGTDFAFTVWLCGLLIYYRPDIDTQEQAIAPRSMFDNRCLHWLQFLRKAYPEVGAEPPGHGDYSIAVLEDDRAAWFDPIRNPAPEEEKPLDRVSTVTSYLNAINICVGKHPQNMYNDSDITLKRLAWCYNVIRNEGVWVPNVQKEEADDEWMLYLEH